MTDMKNIHNCGQCLRRRTQDGLCTVGQSIVPAAQEACIWYAGEDSTVECELCGGRVFTKNSVIFPEETTHITCGQCAGKMGTCATCICVHECAFETDPSPIPPVIQQRIQQGPMTQIISAMNPERIAITCKAGCKCWDSENEVCNKRTAQTCGQYEIVWG